MRNRFVTIIAILCMAGVTAQALSATEQQDIQEQQAWNIAQQESSESSIALYINSYPSGRHFAEASAILKVIKEEAAKGPVMAPAMVSIPGKDYEIGKYEVTQAEWLAVMGSNPSKFSNCGDTCPVEKVSWDEVQSYILKLNARTGKQYRLPTEAEWGYACYGGSQSEYCGVHNVDAVAWSDGNSKEKTHPVGQLQANGYGLYDMSGNVMEWTNDCWEGNCTQRVFRGGSWNNAPRDTRASFRIRFGTAIRNSSGGFRLARSLP